MSPRPLRLTALGAAVVVAPALFVACGSAAPETPSIEVIGAPPETRKVDVTDDFHGTTVADPFRWLEDQDDEEVLAWADRQNVYTESFLEQADDREVIRERLTEMWNFPRWSAPSRHGPWWVWSKNDGLQNQAVLYRATAPDAEGEVMLDPNTLSSDGTVALSGGEFSEDGSLFAYSTSNAGSDWVEWRVLQVETGWVLDDRLEWSKFSSAAWTHDNLGFFYQRYPAPVEGEVYEAQTKGGQLCYHRIGTAQEKDRIIYERPDEPSWGFNAQVTDDGAYAIVSIWEGTDRRNRVAFIDLGDASMPVTPMLFDFDAQWDFVGMSDGAALFVTDDEAPNGRIVAVSPTAATLRLEVVPESGDKLESASIFGGELVATYLEDAKHAVRRFTLEGEPIGEIELPGIGSVDQLSGKREDRVLHLVFSSFTRPGTVYAFDMDAGALEMVRQPELPFDPEDFEVQQVSFQSVDATPMKMFIVHKRGIRFDRENPTVLYGYGGFGVSLTPRFSVENLVFCERGGVYAQATLRGGGEYGVDWHEAGMLANKQNVFDDFVASAKYLLRNDYTVPERLAIRGASNGGLLVGACLVQNPGMFGAAIPEVGVLDMLRYHQFTIGWAWASDYGRSDDPEMFGALYAYSPLHNVEDGTSYPPTLVMTGDHDDRVLPGHSYKFAARLQEAQSGPSPILCRVTRRAGHGGGKPTAFRIAEATDRLAFLGLTIGTR